ncbi:MAG: DUF2828 family protein [Treponema sp.]|nr:DUF2828 family protein [Candidatus Treponema equifaecale]
MNALQAIKTQLNVAHTENGDLAYKSTGSACLDFFSLCGGMRKNISDLDKLFAKAFGENPVIAIKILFYMRNIRGGLGERNSFRILLAELAEVYPEMAKQIVYAVPEYGRWDDLLILMETPVKADAIALIKEQIEKDLAILEKKVETTGSTTAMESSETVSLLGKWLPSVNTSSKEKVALAKVIMKELGMKAVEYRKLCSALRAEIKILENNLRTKDYTFDYSKQPSQAMLRYKKAFMRNDEERYKLFLNKVVEQAEKIARGEEIPEEEKVNLNTKTLYPYQIVAPFMNGGSGFKALPDEKALPLEASWKALDRRAFDSKTIVVRDGSGSMYWSGRDSSAINIATSLALLFSEQLSGAYKNSFITFSSHPELIQVPETADTLQKKLNFISKYNDCSNTDIGKVYDLILQVAKSGNVPKEEMIERVLIISDMEFDYCADGVSTFEFYKQKFEEAGYELPEIVFWNVEARDTHLPVTRNEKGVKLVSGASANIFASVVSGDLKVVTPYEFMLQMLEPYAEFDRIVA